MKDKTKISLLFWGILAFLAIFIVKMSHAANTDPIGTFEPGGNRSPVYRNLAANSTGPILISSAPADAGLGISQWIFREIVNTSSASMMILSNSTSWQRYCGSCTITLSSDTSNISGNRFGDVYVVPHQEEVWAVWSGATNGNGGAVIEEIYQKK